MISWPTHGDDVVEEEGLVEGLGLAAGVLLLDGALRKPWHGMIAKREVDQQLKI